MFNFRSKKIVVVVLVTVISGLVVLTGCGNDEHVIPVYKPVITSPPVEITIDQLYAEYMAYGPAAEDKYNEKRLLFYGVTVEEVLSIFNLENDTFEYNAHIVADNIKFVPREVVSLDNIREDFVVDIVGKCGGLAWPITGEPFLQISDCWIDIVEGEIIEGWYRNPEAY